MLVANATMTVNTATSSRCGGIKNNYYMYIFI
nr:MAG TPA: hypothetical protein [Caudoviricetes sp.]